MSPAKLLFAIGLFAAQPALADSRIFIVMNQPDGYGIDQCLANGERCGAVAARAYCRSRDFTTASAFRKVERDKMEAIPVADSATCSALGCADFVAITCER